MKHEIHEKRKSFKKWGMKDQRTMTDSTIDLMIRRMKSKNPSAIGQTLKRRNRPQTKKGF